MTDTSTQTSPAANGAEPDSRKTSTLFDFTHSAFTLKTCVFRLDGASGQPIMVVSLDSLNASIPVSKIQQSFKIEAGSHDENLIQLLPRALKYVKEIRPGDSIPSEVLDGKASWLVDPKYLSFVRARVTMQLVNWVQGKSFEGSDAATMLTLADDPESKKRMQEAFGAIAAKLGYAPEKKGEVVDLVDKLCRELSYIEALRDKLSGASRRLIGNLRALQGSYGRENAMVDSINRINAILARPIKELSQAFEEIDAGVGEIEATLKLFPQRVQFIRDRRDKLRERYLLWEEILDMWANVPLEASPEAAFAIQETYRFAASKFPQGQKWSLSFR